MISSKTVRTINPMTVVIAGCLISLIGYGIRGDFGLFLKPIQETRGWSREDFALALAVQNLLWGLGQPFAGAIADRFGSARVLIGGAVLYALGVACSSMAGTLLGFNLAMGVAVGFGLSGASFMIVLGSFTRLLPAEKRSWALGLGTAAGSLGQFLFAPLGQGFLTAYGWQTALILLGSSALAIVPLALALRGRGDEVAHAVKPQSLAQALHEAGRHRSYWLLVAGFFVCGFHVAFIQVHMPAYIKDIGLPASIGAWAIGFVGLFNVIGAYGAGVLAGKRSRKRILSGIYFGRAMVIAIFVLTPPSTASVLIFSAAMGILWLSTVPPTSGLVALIFGPRYMTTLFGIAFFSHQVGAFLGVWLGGRIFDATGSYNLMWWISVGLGLAAAAIHWPIVERPVPRLAAAE
jgi:MFS family permease